MGVEQSKEGRIQSFIRWQAEEWFTRLLNPLSSTSVYTYYDIHSFVEIDPSTLRLPRWPDRAWSVIAETWKGQEGTKSGQCAIGMLVGIWYDHSNVVDLLAFDPLPGPFDAEVKMLHQQLLDGVNEPTSPNVQPMSQSRRKRWSQQVDHWGNPAFPLTLKEISSIKKERETE